MAQKTKTPTTQGSINQICYAILFGGANAATRDLLVRFTAAQFGRTVEDIEWRVDATLVEVRNGNPRMTPEAF